MRNKSGKRILQSRLLLVLLWACVLGAAAYSADQLLIKGVLAWHRQQKEYHSMMEEVVILFCVFVVLYGLVKNTILKAVGTLAVLAAFFWCHMVFLPVVVAAVYLVYITSAGAYFCRAVLKLRESDGIVLHFLCGFALVILIFCLMSAAGIGAIGCLQAFVVISGSLLALWLCVRHRYEMGTVLTGKSRGAVKRDGAERRLTGLCLAFIAAMLCIQAGRMNTALDFDSLWYGLRSPYILDNGGGIYENLGAIGIVYTYSKGWEVMTLPLADLPSYSFLLSVNLWFTVGVLYMAYRIACFYMGRGYAMVFAALLSGLPGIMNMAITAKSDIATALFQEIMIYYMLRYLKEGQREWRYLAFSFAAFLLTWTLKPTALVFSTAVFGMSVLFMIWKRLLPWNRERREGKPARHGSRKVYGQAGAAGLPAICLMALAGIWARTIILTGIPVTSVFSSIFTRLGFQIKYPFNVSEIPDGGADLPLVQRLMSFMKRIFGFLLRPVGADMDHIILAWGGFLLFIALLLWIFCLFFKKNVDNERKNLLSCWLDTVFSPFLAVCAVSLYMLAQVDGNYFMLLYILSALYAMCRVVRISDQRLRNGVCAVLVPVMCFCAVVSSLTNWSWVTGFSPVSWNHCGYYDHQEANRREMAEKGNEKIWNILAKDPQNRLIAAGGHPGVLAFPCSAQSYEDITGSWGNVILVKTMDNFVEFMDYAKTDYVYVQAGYTGEGERCISLVRTLIEYGKLIPVCYEEGNVLARVDTNGKLTQTSRAALTEFDKCYIKKSD